MVMRIRVFEVKEALRKIMAGKFLGLDGIPIEVLKCMAEGGLFWLSKFYKIIRTNKMLDEWRKNIIIFTRTRKIFFIL